MSLAFMTVLHRVLCNDVFAGVPLRSAPAALARSFQNVQQQDFLFRRHF
jgi:hypothetical protein